MSFGIQGDIQPFYFPTTTVLVDDHEEYLDDESRKLSDAVFATAESFVLDGPGQCLLLEHTRGFDGESVGLAGAFDLRGRGREAGLLLDARSTLAGRRLRLGSLAPFEDRQRDAQAAEEDVCVLLLGVRDAKSQVGPAARAGE